MLSRIAYFLCTALILYASLIYYPRWRQPATEATIGWDVSGYYWYLPGFLIYKDAKQQGFQQDILSRYQPTPELQQAFKDSASGSYVMKYTAGMSVMYLPFFTAAHLLARPLGYPADGFSPPYQLAIQIGGLLMALLGLWALRRFLKYYYEDPVVAVVLVLIVFGSNYLNWAAIDNGLSHSWLFTVYAVLLLCTHRFYEEPTYGRAAAVGLLVGLAGLTRPTDLMAGLIPVLWGLERISVAALREKLRFFRLHAGRLGVAVVAASAVLLIQPLYWKYATGHWIVYSYGNEGFSFSHPHFKDYTFNYTSGWLIYAPVMIFAFLGGIPFIRHGRNKVMVIVFCLLYYYVTASWDGWIYGSRAMIQSYPVLSLLLAAFVAAAFRRKWLLALAVPCFLVAAYHNFWFTYMAHGGTLYPGGPRQEAGLYDPTYMTGRYFWRVAGRWRPVPEAWKLQEARRIFEGQPRELTLIYRNDFERDTFYFTGDAISGSRSLQVDATVPESRKVMVPLPAGYAGWVRAMATFRVPVREWDIWSMGLWHITYMKGREATYDEGLRVHRVLRDGEAKTLTFDIRLQPGEADSLGIWLSAGRTGKPLLMDDLKVWTFKE